MSSDLDTTDWPTRARHHGRRRAPSTQEESTLPVFLLAAAIGVLVVLRPWILGLFTEHPALASWFTVFVSISLQALPFLVLGVVLSAAIAVLIPPDVITRLMPRRPAAAVPVAGLSGMVLPGCECASVPIAGSLVSRGIRPAIALTFLLAAPAINPVVLVSTAVAFAGQSEMVLARFLASFITAVVMGWLWLRLGRDDLISMPSRGHLHGSRLGRLVAAARHDFLHAGGFLVLGSAIAATVNVLLPTAWLDSLSGQLLVAVLVMAAFAFVVAVCSEADAFLAVAMTQFPRTAQLAFMVVGPAVDIKLFSMQAGTFGRRFAMIFAPATFVVAVLASLIVAGVLL